MNLERQLSRRAVLLGAAASVAAGLLGRVPVEAMDLFPPASWDEPLWEAALGRGLVFGSSAATWELADHAYRALFRREAAILFTEDDLLWYRLRPTPSSGLDFTRPDRIFAMAEQQKQLVFAAHLVWDQGFGPGWTPRDIWSLDRETARRLLFGTIRRVVHRYRGRAVAWVVANEVTGPGGTGGLRTDVPWFQAIGPSYVADAFWVAHAEDPGASLVLNEFGFETVDRYGNRPEDRRRATLRVLDTLLAAGVPVHALGVQAHLLATSFADRFAARAYRRFLADVAARGLDIHVTEMDVLDDGLPADTRARDRGVADVYRRYLDVALEEEAVRSVLCFGLSDRYTWLQGYPRVDGAARRPLAYDRRLRPTPPRHAIAASMVAAAARAPVWPVLRPELSLTG